MIRGWVLSRGWLELGARISRRLWTKGWLHHYFMASTRQSLAKARSAEGESLAKAKNSREISAKACSTKAMTWELESAKVLHGHDANISKASLTQEMWKAQETNK